MRNIFCEGGTPMNNIRISEEAYKEFKDFLDYNNVENYNLKITYMGRNCAGPVFNIDTGKQGPNDILEQVKDINFFIGKDLIDEYEGFIILSNNENNGKGLELKPVKAPKSGCSVCPGC